jgi:hypothetical protein
MSTASYANSLSLIFFDMESLAELAETVIPIIRHVKRIVKRQLFTLIGSSPEKWLILSRYVAADSDILNYLSCGYLPVAAPAGGILP